MARHHPLDCADVKRILKNLGFEPRPQKSTSHEQWVRREGHQFFKVTVDCPKAPFSQDLIRWMAEQAGLNKKEFYRAIEKGAANKIANKRYKGK